MKDERVSSDSKQETNSTPNKLETQIENAYFNDELQELVVTDIDYLGNDNRTITIEFETIHGDYTHKEYFNAPTNGSLSQCDDFTNLLELAGVSPLNPSELVGNRVPAKYDDEGGWKVKNDNKDRTHTLTRLPRKTYYGIVNNPKLAIAIMFVGGELLLALFIVVIFA